MLLFLNLIVFGQENPLEELVRKAANIESGANHIIDIKAAPNDASKSIASVIKYNIAKGDSGEGIEGVSDVDLLLFLVDNASQKILIQQKEAAKYTSDAIRLSTVKLDMADYTIADGIKAFGVRDSYEGSSKPNPSGAENISLYIINGTKFQLILDRLETYSYSGETDMQCNFDGEETRSVLMMEETKTNGFYDIKMRSNKKILQSRKPKKKDGDCIETETKLKPTYKTMSFVNGAYQWKKT